MRVSCTTSAKHLGLMRGTFISQRGTSKLDRPKLPGSRGWSARQQVPLPAEFRSQNGSSRHSQAARATTLSAGLPWIVVENPSPTRPTSRAGIHRCAPFTEPEAGSPFAMTRAVWPRRSFVNRLRTRSRSWRGAYVLATEPRVGNAVIGFDGRHQSGRGHGRRAVSWMIDLIRRARSRCAMICQSQCEGIRMCRSSSSSGGAVPVAYRLDMRDPTSLSAPAVQHARQGYSLRLELSDQRSGEGLPSGRHIDLSRGFGSGGLDVVPKRRPQPGL